MEEIYTVVDEIQFEKTTAIILDREITLHKKWGRVVVRGKRYNFLPSSSLKCISLEEKISCTGEKVYFVETA